MRRYDDPIRTVEDLARSGIFWGTTAPNFINSIKGSEEANYKQIVKKFRVFPEAELVHKAREGTFGLILERTPFGSKFLYHNTFL